MESSEQDKWKLALEEKLQELEECQVKNNLKSCFDCEQLLECKLRKEYVQAVYSSMNKGSTGGFEF